MTDIYSAIMATSLVAAQTDTPLSELEDLFVGQWVGNASPVEQPPAWLGKDV